MQTLTPELRDELRAILDAQAPQAEPVVTKQRIYELLLEYRQDEVRDEDGYGYPLVDALTLDGHGIDMGEREVMNIADMLAGELAAPPSPQPTDNTALVEALEAMLHAVCGETGFAACVRLDSGLAYPWPALDAAEEKAQSALRALKSDDTPAASSPGRAVSSEPVWLDVTARPQEAPTPPVDAHKTPVLDHQAGLSLTDATQAPQADPAVTCNRCGWQGGEDDLIATLDEQDGKPSRSCPECRTDNFLIDVQPEADPVREAALAAGRAQGIEAAANEWQNVRVEGGAAVAAVMAYSDRIRALVPQPEADLETCSDCEGTGIAGHPDSGYTCTKCSGCGGVQPEADPVREAARAAGFAQGIEAALAVVTEEARRQLWHARHVGNDTKTRERASSAWSALNIAAQTIRALAPQPEADPVREAAMRDKIARIIIEDQLQLLSDFDVDGELYRHDPECGAAAYVTADAILRALTGGQP